MPIYEYQCAKCGHRFERLQSLSDPPPKKCPDCGGKVKQLMSAPGLQFKGSGFYITDYAKKSGPAAGDPSKSESKSEAKSESKSESKGEHTHAKPKKDHK